MRSIPKYVVSFDGYIGCFAYLDFGFPVYRFPGGFRLADERELKTGCDTMQEAHEKVENIRKGRK